jgi:hypothetical protein
MLGGLYICTCKKQVSYQIIFSGEIYILHTSYTYGVNYFDVDRGSCNPSME